MKGEPERFRLEACNGNVDWAGVEGKKKEITLNSVGRLRKFRGMVEGKRVRFGARGHHRGRPNVSRTEWKGKKQSTRP